MTKEIIPQAKKQKNYTAREEKKEETKEEMNGRRLKGHSMKVKFKLFCLFERNEINKNKKRNKEEIGKSMICMILCVV